MTRAEAKALFLRYLGEATVNGTEKGDLDFADQFERFLYPAMVQVSALYPIRETAEVSDTWQAPDHLIEITRTRDAAGLSVAFTRLGARTFVFDAACTAEYTRAPAVPGEEESVVLDLDDRAAQLVPLQIAIFAAAASPEHAYQTAYLAASYNAMHAALNACDAVTFRRRYAI